VAAQAHRFDELPNGNLATEEERCVFLTEVKQSAIGRDGGACGSEALLQFRAGRLAADAGEQELKAEVVLHAGAEVNPGVQFKKAQPQVITRARQQHRDDWKVFVLPLPYERRVSLLVLPRPQPVRPDEDGHGAALRQRLFQFRHPRLARLEIPPIEERFEVLLAEVFGDVVNRLGVAPIVAQEDVEGFSHALPLFLQSHLFPTPAELSAPSSSPGSR
jgi:hypothetical protein